MENLKEKIKTTAELLARIASNEPLPVALGIDLDGTIDEAPHFFKFLSDAWNGPVYVITYRDDHDRAVKDLENFGIKVDGIVLVRNLAQKAQFIKKLNIKVYFDDMDEVLKHIPKDVAVFKVRNGGNFDFNKKLWLYSKETGKMI